MNQGEVRDEYLIALADLFEKGNPHLALDWRLGARSEGIPEDFAAKVVAELKGEGAIEGVGSNIRLTPSGYQRYLPRIRALRKLSGREP